MNTNHNFKLYEEGSLVASFEKLTISVKAEGSYTYKAENLSLEDNFHFINSDDNKYTIEFRGEDGEYVDYSLDSCVVNNRSPIKDDIYTLDFIEGSFGEICGTKKI